MTATCCRRRSRLTTPLAMLLGAVLVSGTSAYAAAQITGAQIKDNTVTTADVANNSLTFADIRDGYVIGSDLQNETLTGGKIRNGTVGSEDLAPGVGNKLADVLAVGGLGRQTTSTYTFSSGDAAPMTLRKGQRVLISGYAGYYSEAAIPFFVGTCGVVQGSGAVTYITTDFLTLQGNQRFAVNGLYTATDDQTVTLGACAAHGATPPPTLPSATYTRYTLTVINA